jgi:hypothetical protein
MVGFHSSTVALFSSSLSPWRLLLRVAALVHARDGEHGFKESGREGGRKRKREGGREGGREIA